MMMGAKLDLGELQDISGLTRPIVNDFINRLEHQERYLEAFLVCFVRDAKINSSKLLEKITADNFEKDANGELMFIQPSNDNFAFYPRKLSETTTKYAELTVFDNDNPENRILDVIVCKSGQPNQVDRKPFSKITLARVIASINETASNYRLFRWDYDQLCDFLINDQSTDDEDKLAELDRLSKYHLRESAITFD